MLEIILDVAENDRPNQRRFPETDLATIDVGESTMGSDTGFDELMRRVRAGDDAAETEVFRRYLHRLVALAARQFDATMRERADVENVVLSAYKSFFLRNGRGEFQLNDWSELWSVLAMITVRKCAKRLRHLRRPGATPTAKSAGRTESTTRGGFPTAIRRRTRRRPSPRPSIASCGP